MTESDLYDMLPRTPTLHALPSPRDHGNVEEVEGFRELFRIAVGTYR